MNGILIAPGPAPSSGGSASRTVKMLHFGNFPYNMTVADVGNIIMFDTNGAVTAQFNLPAFAQFIGKRTTFIRLDQNAPNFVLQCQAGENIDGSPTVTLPNVGHIGVDLDCVGDDLTGFVKGWSFPAGSAAGTLQMQAGVTVAPIQAGVLKLGTPTRAFQPYVRGFYFGAPQIVTFAASPYQLQSFDDATIFDTSGGNIIANLNNANGGGQLRLLKVLPGGANTVTVNRQAANTIDGAVSIVLNPGEGRVLQSDAVNTWHIIAKI